MNPCADLSIGSPNQLDQTPPPLPDRPVEEYADLQRPDSDDDDYEDYEISVYADDDELEGVDIQDTTESSERQWRYEEEPYYDDIFQDEEFIEDHFNSDDESSQLSESLYQEDHHQQQTKTIHLDTSHEMHRS